MTGAEQLAARERVRALSSRRLRETIRRGMRLAPVAAVIWLVFGAATLLEKVVRRLRARMTGPAQ